MRKAVSTAIKVFIIFIVKRLDALNYKWFQNFKFSEIPGSWTIFLLESSCELVACWFSARALWYKISISNPFVKYSLQKIMPIAIALKHVRCWLTQLFLFSDLWQMLKLFEWIPCLSFFFLMELRNAKFAIDERP